MIIPHIRSPYLPSKNLQFFGSLLSATYCVFALSTVKAVKGLYKGGSLGFGLTLKLRASSFDLSKSE